MNSAQSKMRTNGVFLRSFDSKRYQELQLQKQQILQKQRELQKIKEKRSKKRKPNVEGKIDEEPCTDEGADSSASSSKSHSTNSLNQMAEEVGDCDDAVDDAISAADDTAEQPDDISVVVDNEQSNEQCDSQALREVSDTLDINGSSSVGNGEISSETDKTDCVSETKIVSEKQTVETPEVSSVDDCKAKVNDTSIKANNVEETYNPSVITEPQSDVTTTKAPCEKKATKEYAIIAKINKQAIIRGSELVEKETEAQSRKTEIDAIVPDKEIQRDILHSGKLLKSDKRQRVKSGSDLDELGQVAKACTEAYAVVDLEKTMSFVKKLEKEKGKSDKDQTKDKSKDTTSEDSASAILAKANKLSEKAQQIQELREQIYARKYGRMSRSAGYNGDMDTSCSSLEPDIDSAVDKFLSNKLSGSLDDRLVITDEQLSSMNYVGSSSSG